MKLNVIVRSVTLGASLALFQAALPTTSAGDQDKHSSAGSYGSTKDIVGVAAGNDQFKTLVTALKAAGLVETLQGTGPFTVFAPTDAAFAKLPKGTLEDLLKPENKEKLTSILTYHVLAGKVLAADVKTMEAKTVQGQKMKLKVSDSGVTADNAKVLKTDIMAKNGVIHVIDAVILPAS